MQKTCGCRKNTLPLHSQSGIESIDDSVAQQVEHNTFNVGVLGSSPSWITKRKAKRRQKEGIDGQKLVPNSYPDKIFKKGVRFVGNWRNAVGIWWA